MTLAPKNIKFNPIKKQKRNIIKMEEVKVLPSELLTIQFK